MKLLTIAIAASLAAVSTPALTQTQPVADPTSKGSVIELCMSPDGTEVPAQGACPYTQEASLAAFERRTCLLNLIAFTEVGGLIRDLTPTTLEASRMDSIAKIDKRLSLFSLRLRQLDIADRVAKCATTPK